MVKAKPKKQKKKKMEKSRATSRFMLVCTLTTKRSRRSQRYKPRDSTSEDSECAKMYKHRRGLVKYLDTPYLPSMGHSNFDTAFVIAINAGCSSRTHYVN